MQNKYTRSDGCVSEMESYIAKLLAPFKSPNLTMQYQISKSAPMFCTHFCSMKDTDAFD